MITILSFLIVLTILVMVHEVGHLVAAKALGIRVEAFAIGFGPRLGGIRRGGTDYALRLIPLGGYVQLGETGPSEIFRPSSSHYSERPPFHKIIVASSGPLANLLLAVLVLGIVSLIGVSAPAYMSRPAVVGWVAPASGAERAGLAPGDTVIDVDGTPIATWQEAIRTLPLYDKDIAMQIARDGKARSVTLNQSSRLTAGFFPKEQVMVGAVGKGSPAERAGIRSGDVILTADGRSVDAWGFFQKAVEDAREPLTVALERDGKAFTAVITPEIDPKTGKRLAGISGTGRTETRRFGPLGALENGFRTTASIVSDSVGTFRGLATGSLSLKMLGGPIAIARASGTTARDGLVPLLSFLAFLSVQLGIFNLLPFFPVVDGGQITIFLFEMVRRRPMKTVPLERLLKAGWVAMGVLVLFVTYNDVMNLF